MGPRGRFVGETSLLVEALLPHASGKKWFVYDEAKTVEKATLMVDKMPALKPVLQSLHEVWPHFTWHRGQIIDVMTQLLKKLKDSGAKIKDKHDKAWIECHVCMLMNVSRHISNAKRKTPAVKWLADLELKAETAPWIFEWNMEILNASRKLQESDSPDWATELGACADDDVLKAS